MPFLPPNQQRQSTEGRNEEGVRGEKMKSVDGEEAGAADEDELGEKHRHLSFIPSLPLSLL